MKDFLTIVSEKTQEFGNHYRKQLQAVRRFYEPMLENIEICKKREMVHFMHPSNNFPEELKIVAGVAKSTEEKFNFIGAYFALHLLWMNRHLIDMLRIELFHSTQNRYSIYKNFMRQAGNKFRLLTAAYLNELLKTMLKNCNHPLFAILGVGTKSDQDDIDIGIIDDGSNDRVSFNQIIGRVNQEMIRYATSLHFHLSEHIGTQHFSASIEEYKKALKKEIKDFVIINEMLGAALIIGDENLFQVFKKEVTSRYFYYPGKNNKFHEGYLRGIIGEIRTLLAKAISKSKINFKEDGLRPIKGIISAKKTIYNVWQVNAWDIIDELKKIDYKRNYEYDILERALTFIEIFRYLYQLFISQDEEVIIDDVSLNNIRKIALLLGYRDVGYSSAEQHLLIHYYEHIMKLRSAIPVLCDDVKIHLQNISTFTPLFKTDYQRNLTLEFIKRFKFFKGTSFWDDILDNFKSETILNRFLEDFEKLVPENQNKIIKNYIDWLKFDFYILITFLTILGSYKKSFALYKKMNTRFLKIMDKIPDVGHNIAFIYHRHPQLVNKFFEVNLPEDLEIFRKMLKRTTYEDDVSVIVNELNYLLEFHLIASRFLKRFFGRIAEKYPETLSLIKNLQQVKEFANSIYSDVISMRTFAEKKEKLADYYALEMVRVSLATLQGQSPGITNAEFIEFSDQYIKTLYDICRAEVNAEFNKAIITEDFLAIFASGGYAREQAFGDDYDLIVLLNSEDPDLLSYSNRVINKMNAEIIKSGTIPQHRIAEYFGRFVILFKEIENFLSEDRDDIFIEQSQILEARLITGSYRFKKKFLNIILQAKIFAKKEKYIKQMLNELYLRHVAEKRFVNPEIDIKECSGGLRDIEMLLLILKAFLEINEPVNLKLFNIIVVKLPNFENEFITLQNHYAFIKRMRDLNRLTSGATDTILNDNLAIISSLMGFGQGEQLYKRLTEVRNEVIDIIKRISFYIKNTIQL